ncbi:MAG: hypothetical protein RLZZ28_1469, partial [Bacteroidota bacterium]
MAFNRRRFLTMSAGITGLALSSLESLFAQKKSFIVPEKFSLKMMGTNWG